MSSNQLSKTNQTQLSSMHGQKELPASVNSGSVAIEQERAIAEAQGQLTLAKKFPRDEFSAHEKLMKSCSIPSLASVAFYSVPRAGGVVSGPTIRLAEEIARCYGNFEYGHRELSRDEDKSEVEVYAWDKENNNYSRRQMTVMHVRDTKQGQFKLRDQKDIDDKIANVASKQVRGRILALMPKWMVEDAIQACRNTLAGSSREPIESRVRKMIGAFSQFGITSEMLQTHLGHPLSSVTVDEIVDLMGVYNSIKEGHIKASDHFQSHEVEPSKEVVQAAGKQRSATEGFKPAEQKKTPLKKSTPKAAEPEPEPEPEQEVEHAQDMMQQALDAVMDEMDQVQMDMHGQEDFDPENY